MNQIISHNAPFSSRNLYTCAHFCHKMVHCGICATGLLQSCQCYPGYLQQVYCKAVNVTLGICNRSIAKLSMLPWVFATGLLQSCQCCPGYLQQVYCKAVNVTLGICNRSIAKLSMLPWAFATGLLQSCQCYPGHLQQVYCKAVNVTLGISGSSIESQWISRKYPG